ncbi:MAG: hypothetical protein ACNI3A_18595 [Desulfovibrio sp.]|uniref:hypothetical protein n=1 Tax=Desulfovibrio sp. 7SRBS1 TaxID=3378064 RepID=UPI003B3DD022
MAIVACLQNIRRADGSRVLITYSQEDAGLAPDGSWDELEWEAAQTEIYALPGVSLRIAWKEIYRFLRCIAKDNGGLDLYTGFLPSDQVPLPDRAN